ncbi:MAG: DNA glycosylase AlkZ-like family protein, partial [Anaerolineales bacterium]
SSTFQLSSKHPIRDIESAIQFVNQRGFIFFWPIKDILLPSLWVAVAGDRPVAEKHDDPGHITWTWKDSLLGAKRWYYAKVLRKKATMISLEVAPYFYALSENYGSPEDDYLILYEQGFLTQEAKLIYEALLESSPMDTVSLRRATHLTSRESDHRFSRGLAELQTDFKIIPVGVTQAGGWRYAHTYDLVHRHYPHLPEKARFINQRDARQKLVTLYFHSVGAAQLQDLVKLFGWQAKVVEEVVLDLVQTGSLLDGVEVESQPGEWLALATLIDH